MTLCWVLLCDVKHSFVAFHGRFFAVVPPTKPLEVVDFVVIAPYNVVTVSSLIWTTASILQFGFTYSTRSCFDLLPFLFPVFG